MTRLKQDVAAYKVALEAKDAQIAEMESRMVTLTLVRDEEVAKRAMYEMAQWKAFNIPAAPLIRPRNEGDDTNAAGGSAVAD